MQDQERPQKSESPAGGWRVLPSTILWSLEVASLAVMPALSALSENSAPQRPCVFSWGLAPATQVRCAGSWRVSLDWSRVMRRSIGRSVGAIIGFGVLLAACSGTKSEGPSGDGVGGAGPSGAGGSFGGRGPIGAGGSISCTPDAKRCDGSSVKQCDESGFKETITQTCLSTQTCSNGACAAGACVPNTSTCKDGVVWKCNEDGVSTQSERCATGLFCRVDGDVASCNAQACSKGQPLCNDNVATTCNADGSGVVAGGVDCGKSSRACAGGQCYDVVCKVGEKSCQHGDVYLCSHNGTDVSLLTTCRSDEVCDAEMGSCRKKLCEPGKAACEGTRAQTCNEFGSAWLPAATECATDGKICVNGSCKKQLCAASRSFCQDGNVYSCDASGTAATLSQTCNASTEHCATYNGGSFGYCKANDCHSGDSVCDGDVIKVCNADGSLPASGTACSESQTCENAKCKERPCVPGNYLCKGADVYYCDFSSPFLSLQQTCEPDSSCKAVGTTGAACAPFACSPSAAACVGDKLGTCAADGLGLSAVTTDCTATANVCTTELKCAKSATDTIGVAEKAELISGSNLIVDVIDVDSTRKLTELQAQLVFTGTLELRWIVYELTGQMFVPKYDKLVSGVTGTGAITSFNSGALNYKLTAGKRYALGVVITGGDVFDYVDSLPYTRDVSFGTVTGRVVSYYPNTFDVFSVDTSYVSRMSMTTEAP